MNSRKTEGCDNIKQGRMVKWILLITLSALIIICLTGTALSEGLIGSITSAYIKGSYSRLPLNKPLSWTIVVEGVSVDDLSIYCDLLYRPDDNNDSEYTMVQRCEVEGNTFSFTISEEGHYLIFVTLTDRNGDSVCIESNFYNSEGVNGTSLSQKIQEILNACKDSGASTSYKKAKFVHDYIINHADYDLNANHKDDPEGVLLYGKGICQSYSYAYQLLLREMGIECLLIQGIGNGEPHVWNLVHINDQWYHVDCTYDDPIGGNENDTYFMVSDDFIGQDHEWNRSLYPVCPGEADEKYDFLFASQDEFFEKMNALVESGRFENIRVRYTGNDPEFTDVKLRIFSTNWINEFNKNNSRFIGGSTMQVNGPNKFIISYFIFDDDIDNEDYSIYSDFGYRVNGDEITIVRYLGNKANVTVPSHIEQKPVTHIGNYTFCNNTTIQSVTLPDTLKVIEDGTFNSIFDNGWAGAFMGCTSLTSIDIPGSVSIIGTNAFMDCTSLAKVNLHQGLSIIGENTFQGCTSLRELAIPEGLTTIKQNGISRTNITTLSIPASVTSFHPINELPNLEKITVSNENPVYSSYDGVMYEGNYLIHYPAKKSAVEYRIRDGCDSCEFGVFPNDAPLKKIIIPTSMRNLEGIGRLPAGLETIEVEPGNPEYTSVNGIVYSKDMTSLASIPRSVKMDTYEMPKSVQRCSPSAFYEIETIRKLVVSPGLTQGPLLFLRCTNLEEVIFPTSWPITESPCFEECPNLKSVALPKGIKALNGTFYMCSSLTNVTLPEGLIEIGPQTFVNCSSLREITIPESVNTIADIAFGGCGPMVLYMSTVPTYISNDCFGAEPLIYGPNPDLQTFAEQQGIFYAKPPEARTGLKSTGLPQALLLMPSSPGGWWEVQYALGTDESTAPVSGWSTDVPKGIDEGNYYVWYRFAYEGNYCCSKPACITITIAEGDPESDDKVEAYVTRCYRIILGREPDTGGLNTWYNELISGQKAAAEIIEQFVNSQEFINKKLSNGDSVEILYKAMLGRGSDPAGKTDWVAKLNDGQPLTAVIDGFCGSAEFGAICDSYGIQPGSVTPQDPSVVADGKIRAFVTRCYSIILGRNPDEGGLDTWFNELKSGRQAASEIIDSFVRSQEFVNKNYNNEDSVEILYKAMLGRPSDPAGKADWISKLEAGQTLAAVINGFCGSAEFGAICDSYGIQPGSVSVDQVDVSDTQIRAFVTRCYKIILGRDADEGGMNTWAGELKSQRKAAAEIIESFINSQEFKNKNYSNPDAIEILYKAMLGRGSDAAGKADWVSKMNAGQPLTAVINGFCGSAEFKAICDAYGITPGTVKVENVSKAAEETAETVAPKTEKKANLVEITNASDTVNENLGTAVQAIYINEEKAQEFIGRCYRAILGREAGEEELNGWISQMMNGSKTADQIARGFLFSDEFKTRSFSNEELVKILYKVYMNRDADPEGLATWTQKLEEGTGLNDLLDIFSKTNEFKTVVRNMAQ